MIKTLDKILCWLNGHNWDIEYIQYHGETSGPDRPTHCNRCDKEATWVFGKLDNGESRYNLWLDGEQITCYGMCSICRLPNDLTILTYYGDFGEGICDC